MTLVQQYWLMNPKQKDELYSTMLNAGIAIENGNEQWREVFRTAKNNHLGRQKHIYDSLYCAGLDEIDNLIEVLIEKN